MSAVLALFKVMLVCEPSFVVYTKLKISQGRLISLHTIKIPSVAHVGNSASDEVLHYQRNSVSVDCKV